MTIKIQPIITSLFLAAGILYAADASGGNGQPGATDDAASPAYQTAAKTAQEPSAATSGSDDIIVFKLAGDGQQAPAGQWTPASLEVGTWKESGPEPLINVPVDFSLVAGGGWLARTPGIDGAASVQILTDADGIAQVWHRQPEQPNVQSSIMASALGKSVTFTTYSILPADGAPASGASHSSAEASTGTLPSSGLETTAVATPAKPTQKELLASLVSGGSLRRAGAPAPQSKQHAAAPKTKTEIATGSDLPDAYFAYPADHPLGQIQRGMILYAAAGKARELRDTEQALMLAAEAKAWLLLALESESTMSTASSARCHYYLGKIAERYNGNQTAALQHYRTASEKDAARKQAKAAVKHIEHVNK